MKIQFLILLAAGVLVAGFGAAHGQQTATLPSDINTVTLSRFAPDLSSQSSTSSNTTVPSTGSPRGTRR